MYYFLTDVLQVKEDTAHKDSCLVEHLLSSETRTKLFEFMRSISLEPKKYSLSTQFDLSEFDDHKEFLAAQKGDKYV